MEGGFGGTFDQLEAHVAEGRLTVSRVFNAPHSMSPVGFVLEHCVGTVID